MYKITLFALLICGIAACKDKITPSAQDTVKGLIPLAEGNTWHYKKTIYDSATGAVKITTGDTILISSHVSINGIFYYQVQQASMPVTYTSFLTNVDSNTVQKTDSATQYVFFKRVTADQNVSQWPDTVKSRCIGQNNLRAFAGDTTIGSYTGCLKNVVSVNDCTGQTFQKWVYYLKPGTGLIRIEHYLVMDDKINFYLDFADDLLNFNIQ